MTAERLSFLSWRTVHFSTLQNGSTRREVESSGAGLCSSRLALRRPGVIIHISSPRLRFAPAHASRARLAPRLRIDVVHALWRTRAALGRRCDARAAADRASLGAALPSSFLLARSRPRARSPGGTRALVDPRPGSRSRALPRSLARSRRLPARRPRRLTPPASPPLPPHASLPHPVPPPRR